MTPTELSYLSISTKDFKYQIKEFTYVTRPVKNYYLKLNNSRLTLSHQYVRELLLAPNQKWNPNVLHNRYLQFFLNPNQFLKKYSEELGDPFWNEHALVFLRLTDKYLIPDILNNNTNREGIKNDPFIFKKDHSTWLVDEGILNDYYTFVKALHKINMKKGSMKTMTDFEKALAPIEEKYKAKIKYNKDKAAEFQDTSLYEHLKNVEKSLKEKKK